MIKQIPRVDYPENWRKMQLVELRNVSNNRLMELKIR
jgi:hypothetical protein